MVLFSRNPRFRSLSKLYGYLVIISAGTFHWLNLNKQFILNNIQASIKSISQGKDPLEPLKQSQSFSTLEIKDNNFLSTLNSINSSESRKKLLINQEEFLKMQIWKDLHNKSKL